MSARLARVALALYPLAFKRRYGDELEALVEQSRPRPATVANLLRGAAAAHLRPPAAAEAAIDGADRIRASAVGVLGCWVVFAAAGFGFYKTTENFDAAGYEHPLLVDSHQLIQVLASVASATVVLAALPLIAAALVHARRHRSVARLIGRPLLPAAAFAVLTAVLVLVAHASPSRSSAGTGGHVAAVLWALAGLACAAACVAACRASLFASPAPPRRLLAALAGSWLVAAAMAAITVAVAVYAIALRADEARLGTEGNGPFQLLSVDASLVIVVVVMAVASALAVTAARRGWRARVRLTA
jgi:hypothetical protein